MLVMSICPAVFTRQVSQCVFCVYVGIGLLTVMQRVLLFSPPSWLYLVPSNRSSFFYRIASSSERLVSDVDLAGILDLRCLR